MLAMFTCLVCFGAPAPAEVVGSFVSAHCLSCHSGPKAKGSLSLEKMDSAAVVKNRKAWIQVLERTHGGDMPPASKPRPDPKSIEAFSSAVEAIWDVADRASPPDPGKVTARRLNRVEYANTVRDLIGVDFNPSEDFPADDIGYGFDNIGDVLSLPPILLERYLASAESIVDRAIVLNPPKPPVRHMSARYLEPAQPKDLKRRELTKDTLHTPFNLNQEGKYTFRVRAASKAESGIWPKVSLMANDTVLKTAEVITKDDKTQVIEIEATLPAGPTRFSVRVDNAGSGERALLVEWFEVTGPADTRPPSHLKLLATTATTDEQRLREVLGRFTRRAYRRPVRGDELNRLVAMAQAESKATGRWEAGAKIGIMAVLVSPHFLFRVERDDRPARAQMYPVSDIHLASRLSYFLWSTMPDETLLALAEKGQLSGKLEEQVKRMLADPKSSALVEQFFPQWLQLRRLDSFAPDLTRFPVFNDQLRKAMREEAMKLFDTIVREDRPATELVSANYTFLNQRLAGFYGIADTAGNAMHKKPTKPGGKAITGESFVKVDTTGWPRGGVTNMAAVLAVTSNPTRTSPVKRGKWVLEQLLGAPPPPAPPNVPELKEGGEALKGTLKQRMEQHRSNPSCSSCHQKMDALGFAFESFNAIGAFRDKDEGQPIDATGELPGGVKLNGPQAVKDYLGANRDKFMRALTEKLLIYAMGRGLEPYDRRAVDTILKRSAGKNDRFSEVVLAIVASDPFRFRRGEEPKSTEP